MILDSNAIQTNDFKDVPVAENRGNLEENSDSVIPESSLDLKTLNDLASTNWTRFLQVGRIEDLEEAMKYRRKALDICPPGHPNRSDSLNNLAIIVSNRFMRSGRIEDLEEGIAYHRQALTLRPPGHPDRSYSLTNLAITVTTRFKKLGRMEDLEEAIAYHRQVLDLLSFDHPNRAHSLTNLASTVLSRFGRLGRIEDLKEAITYNRQALTLCPPGHPNRSDTLINLANAITTRFQHLGRMEDLEEGISYHRQALDLCPSGYPNRSCSLNNLATAVFIRFGQLGRMEDLEEAITYHSQSLALRLPGHPGRSVPLINLANTIYTRFRQLGRLEDLEEAITYHREVLDLHPPGHPNRSDSLNNLAAALSTRFQQLGKIEDLEEGIAYDHQALALRPPGHPNRFSSLNNLADSIFIRFQELGRMEDLEEAISYHRQGLDLFSPGQRNRSNSLDNFASVISTRFRLLGRLEDLDEAIACYRQALDLNPPGHPNRSGSLNNLAMAFLDRFEQLGSMEDLEETIMYHRQALDLCPLGHPDHPRFLDNLGRAIFTRFEQSGRIEDLEEAEMYHRQALSLRPLEQPSRSSTLNYLAAVISSRFRLFGRIEDLEVAFTYLRQALECCPPGNLGRSSTLSNLAGAFWNRFHTWKRTEDLEEAITYYRQALILRPPGHPRRPSSLNNLSITLYTRFQRFHRIEDLEEVIAHLSEAEAALPMEHPLHVFIRSNLASSYLSHPNSGAGDHTSAAFALFESAAGHSTANSRARFTAALQWTSEAQRLKHESTMSAYSKALTLLDRCLVINPTIELQQKFLAATTVTFSPSLASDAAASAIEAGQLEVAVELLEQGRAMLWSKMRGYRHSLERLREVDKSLADQFETLSGQLEHQALSSVSESVIFPTSSSVRNHGPPVSFEVNMRAHRILSEKWEEIVERIRLIDGFSDFLRAIPFATLQTAAAEGPVILINICKYRSDAIILYGTAPPILVPLPEALLVDLAPLGSQLAKAQASDAADASKMILPILRSLWDVIVCPVRDQLTLLGVAEKSRIWWCPTSVLCGLPIHAAGPYLTQQRNLVDIYVSSYTPTLSSLIRARSGMAHGSTVPSLLVIGQPDETLPEVNEEIRRIQQFGTFVEVLVGKEADRDAVLSRLQKHPWAHFSCHGHLNAQPFQSSFQLHGHSPLTLIDLIKARLPNAEFAFLSACHSAAGDILGTPDEVIHLAAALQFCGFRSVVGTLWAMEDIDGRDVALDFYSYMFRAPKNVADFRDSAKALNLATRAMRRKGIALDRWIKFVHIGA